MEIETNARGKRFKQQKRESYVKLAIKPAKQRNRRHKHTKCRVEVMYLDLKDIGINVALTNYKGKIAIQYCSGQCTGKNIYDTEKCCVATKMGKRYNAGRLSDNGQYFDLLIEQEVERCECR